MSLKYLLDLGELAPQTPLGRGLRLLIQLLQPLLRRLASGEGLRVEVTSTPVTSAPGRDWVLYTRART